MGKRYYQLTQTATDAVLEDSTTYFAVDKQNVGTKKLPANTIAKRQYGTNEVHNLATTATESDLVAGNYLALDGSAGTKKLPSELVAKRSVQDKLTEKIIEIDSPILGAEYTATANAYRDFWNRECPANEELVIYADPAKVTSVIFCTMSYTNNYEVPITEEITFVTLQVAKQMIRVYSVVSDNVKIKVEKKSNTSVLQNEIRISNLESVQTELVSVQNKLVSVQNKLVSNTIEIDSPILGTEYTATANAYRDFWNRESPANEPLVILTDPTKVSSVIFCTMSYTENYEVAITEEITFVTLPVAKQMIRVYSVVSDDVKIKIEKRSNTSVLQNEIRISDLEQREVNCVKEYDLSKFSKIQGSYRTSNIYDGNSYGGDYKTIKNVPVVKGDFYRVEFKGETYSAVVSIIANMSGDTQIGTQIRGSSNDGVVTTATFKAQSDFISLSFPYNYIKLFHIGSCLTFDKIVLFGDSITEEWNASNGDYTNRISTKFNCNNVVKLGFGGYMLAGNSNKPLTKKVSLVISERPLQLVILLAGTNDYGNGTELGTYESAISDSGSACSGLKYIINEIMTKSDANFLYCNPIKRSGQSSAMTTYARELMKAVYQYKVDYPKFSDRIMVADLQTYFGLEPSLESSSSTRWYTTDGLHLNFVGYERLTDLEKETVLLNLKGIYHI